MRSTLLLWSACGAVSHAAECQADEATMLQGRSLMHLGTSKTEAKTLVKSLREIAESLTEGSTVVKTQDEIDDALAAANEALSDLSPQIRAQVQTAQNQINHAFAAVNSCHAQDGINLRAELLASLGQHANALHIAEEELGAAAGEAQRQCAIAQDCLCDEANERHTNKQALWESMTTTYELAYCEHNVLCEEFGHCHRTEMAIYTAMRADVTAEMAVVEQEYIAVEQSSCLTSLIMAAFASVPPSPIDFGAMMACNNVDTSALNINMPDPPEPPAACPASTMGNPQCGPVVCPEGWEQVGEYGADIGGCGLQGCGERYDIDTAAACAARCDTMDRCIGFNFCPENGDRNHESETICTVYDSDSPTGSWSGSAGAVQVFCRRETGFTSDGCLTSNYAEGEHPTTLHFDPSRTAAVRCCSYDGGSCETQNLPDSVFAPVLNMEGNTVGSTQNCVLDKTYAEAQSICARADKRLCSVSELNSGVCCGTGCWHDHRAIWTRDPPTTTFAPEWTMAVSLTGNGATVETDIGQAEFNRLFNACPTVKYTRNGGVHSVYVRRANRPQLDAFSLFTYRWANANNNLGSDFDIYDSEADARAGTGAWQFCNYNDPDVGYPRDCGRNGGVGNTWFTMPASGQHDANSGGGGQRFDIRGINNGASFEIYTGTNCPVSQDWTMAVSLTGNGGTVETDIGQAEFNRLFNACPVVKYTRNGGVHSVYKRLSGRPQIDAFSIFTYRWANANNNLGQDFNIYDNEADARSGSGAWSFCNYNDPDVGYPRDCGKSGGVGNTWFTMPGSGQHDANSGGGAQRFDIRGINNGASFEIYTGNSCP